MAVAIISDSGRSIDVVFRPPHNLHFYSDGWKSPMTRGDYGVLVEGWDKGFPPGTPVGVFDLRNEKHRNYLLNQQLHIDCIRCLKRITGPLAHC